VTTDPKGASSGRPPVNPPGMKLQPVEGIADIEDPVGSPDSWGPATRDFLVFEGKLFVDGFLDFVMAPVAALMFLIDLISGDRSGRRFYGLLRRGRRFEHWLRLYRPSSRSGPPKDNLGEAGLAGADHLVAKIEGMVREQELPEAYRVRLRAVADRARALKGTSRTEDRDD